MVGWLGLCVKLILITVRRMEREREVRPVIVIVTVVALRSLHSPVYRELAASDSQRPD